MACDGAYAMPLAVALRSLLEAARDPSALRLHVLVDAFPEEARAKVAASLPAGSPEIRWIPVDLGLFGGFATLPGISRMTYARLLIDRVLPPDTTRALYIDVDVLVLDDVATLWFCDLGGKPLGAVIDGTDGQMKAGLVDMSDIPVVEHYFNAGMLLIDLPRWRAERVSETALAFLTQHPRTRFSDQDALNVACDRLWQPLDARWNFQGHLQTRIARLAPAERPGIVHFVTGLKPWRAESNSINAGLYDAVRQRTGYRRSVADRVRDVAVGVVARAKRLLMRSRTVRQWRESLRNRRPAAALTQPR